MGVFSIALATVILPGLSSHHAEKSVEQFSATLDWALRLTVLVVLPAALGLLLLPPVRRALARRLVARSLGARFQAQGGRGGFVFTAGGKEVSSQAQGNGPVDASLKAIEAHVQSGAEMVLYSVNAISGSTESQGEVTVRLQNSGRVVNGVGSDPDIVVASAKAYLSALNKLHSKAERVAAQG